MSHAERAPAEGMLLSHEWIAPAGGSENVFRELLDIYPDADAVCLWNDAPGTFDRPIRESCLASSRLRGRKAMSLPLMPLAWRNVDLKGYGAVLASSHAFGHHLAGRAARAGIPAFAYVHTPARYIWAPEVEARGRGLAARLGSPPLRRVDRRATSTRVRYAANSHFVRDRIGRAWGQEATVIYPPVEVERITSIPRWRDALTIEETSMFDALPSDAFVLGASRLVSYKRLDKAIEVGEALGIPVVIAGSGPDEGVLRRQAAAASVPVFFTGRVSDPQMYALYQEASLYVFLPIEDFGIMPVEAVAAGTPVLVNEVGGAAGSIATTLGGLAIRSDLAGRGLAAAAEEAMRIDPVRASERAGAFSRAAFRERVAQWVSKVPA